MFHPNREDRMIDGAYTLMPVEKPRESRNNAAVNVLVFTSNLFSKNSYGVNTFSFENAGTKVIQSTTIAKGNPK